MPDHEAPTVIERQRVDRLVAAVMAGLDPRQAIGAAVTDRLGIVTAVMMGEASDRLFDVPQSEPLDLSTPGHRRFLALGALFNAMGDVTLG